MWIGHLSNKYRIRQYLGSGAYSDVFLAIERLTDRMVVVKGVRKSSYCYHRLRFLLSELQIMARIAQHPNIAQLHTVEPATGGDDDDYIAWLIIEYVEGQDLHALIQAAGPLSLANTLGIGLQIFRAIAHIHDHRIIHRDVKPSNCLVTPDQKVKIIDFGVACGFDEPTDVAGTRSYMAPEAYYTASHYSNDLYSTAVTLFVVVTGRLPFSGGIREKLAGNIDHLDEVPEKLHDFFQKALDPDPYKRYRDANEMYDKLNYIFQQENEQHTTMPMAAANPAVERGSSLG